MHEYLRDTLVDKYAECKSCLSRTEYTCAKCGFCWSCHWKVEQSGKFEPHNDKPLIVGAFDSSFKGNSQTYGRQEKGQNMHQRDLLGKVRYYTKDKVIDVFGLETEPICDYLRCHHKFSVHGVRSGICQCRHPRNIAAGA